MSAAPAGSLLARSDKEFCISVCEEFGYHSYVWFPPFPATELESKWKSVPACGAKGMFDVLGGEWVEVMDEPQENSAEEDAVALYEKINVSTLYTAHICCDQDSHLITPDRRVLVHAGFDWEHSRSSDFDPALIEQRLEK